MLQNDSEPPPAQPPTQAANTRQAMPRSDDDESLDHHVRWLFEEILGHLESDDFSTGEIGEMLIVLRRVHSRVLRALDAGQRPTGTLLHLIRE